MMDRSFRSRALACAWIAALGATTGHAQEARIWAANTTDNHILKVEFDPANTLVVNTDADRLVSLQSLEVRDNGIDGIHLIACDTLGAKVLFYQDAMGDGQIISDPSVENAPPLPNGLSIDGDQNLLGVSSGLEWWAPPTTRVWAMLRDLEDGRGHTPLSGGYRTPIGTLDDEVVAITEIFGLRVPVKVRVLQETVIVPSRTGILNSGDLLVAASDPPFLLRYRSADVANYLDELRALPPQAPLPPEITPDVLIHPAWTSVPDNQKFPPLTKPVGVAFTPDGSILLPTNRGEVLLFDSDGTRRIDGNGDFVDFANGLGRGLGKISTGPIAGSVRAFVSQRDSDEALQFLIREDGTGELEFDVSEDLHAPNGITTSSSNNVETPIGFDVAVNPSGLLENTFAEVTSAGLTNARILLVEDPREKERSKPPHRPSHRPLSLKEIDPSFPAVEIPEYVRAFRRNDADTGPPTFILALGDTSAEFVGLLSHFSDESSVLGYKPDCDSPDSFQQPRLFWAPDENDAPIVEGPRFIDITTDCGTNRGLTRGFSFFLLGVRDVRKTDQIAAAKIDGMIGVTESDCIDKDERVALLLLLDSAALNLANNEIALAIADIMDVITFIENNRGAFSDCKSAELEELLARAVSTIFILEKLL